MSMITPSRYMWFINLNREHLNHAAQLRILIHQYVTSRCRKTERQCKNSKMLL